MGIRKLRCIQNDIVTNAYNVEDHMAREYNKLDEPDSADVRNEGGHSEDARYRRLVEQANQELYLGSKFYELSFLLHLFHLKSMCGWFIKLFDMLLQLLASVFPQLIISIIE